MRILYTHRTQGVGAEGAHVLGMFEAFQELGHDIKMDCLPGCNPAEPKPIPPSMAPTLKPSVFQKIYWFIADHSPEMVFELFELAYNFPLFLRLVYQYFRFRPDMLYERYALNTFAPTLLCRFTGCKHILEVNDSVVIERSRPLALRRIAARCENYCLNGSQIIITITENFKSLLTAHFPISSQRILVLPNAVSRRRFDRTLDRIQIRKQLGIDTEGIRVIGASGQFLPWHGLLELIEFLGPFAKEKNLFFLFIGDGPVKNQVLEKAQTLGIADRVRFTGMVPITSVPEFLAALDMAVIPSAAQHASPMKLMEYMAAGLPIVAPDLPSITAVNGVDPCLALFPAQDFEKMQKLIFTLIHDPGLARELGRKAKTQIFETLTWTSHAKKLVGLLFPEAKILA